MSFRNQTVVITGASTGIGRALVKEFATQGAKVGAIARRAELLDELAKEVRAIGGVIETAPADVAKREQIQSAVRQLQEKLGPVDLLLANAGVAEYTGANPVNVPGVEWMIQVNYLGVVYAFEALLPDMLARGSGHLVAVSSLAAYKGLPGSAGYCASKAAVSSYCEALRIELGDKGIAVTTVCPGFIRTPMTDQNAHPMPFIMEPEEAAKRIARALSRRPKVYNFPWIMYRLMRATRWLPDRTIRKRLMGGPKKPV